MVFSTASHRVVFRAMDNNFKGEEEIWKSILKEENERRVKEKLQRNSGCREWPRKGSRDSAVLVPLVSVEGEPSILFTVRSAQLSRHRNQVR